MKPTYIASYAKVNMLLEVTGQDPKDGYHFIESVMQEISLHDDIWIAPADPTGQDPTGQDPTGQDPTGQDFVSPDSVRFEGEWLPSGETTVHRAIRYYREVCPYVPPLAVQVHKRIPIGGGLGGGSSNAAAVLRVLNQAFPLPRTPSQGTSSQGASLPKALLPEDTIPKERLWEIAFRVGADVPFFLKGGLAYVSGKGEHVQSLDGRLADVACLLWYPGFSCGSGDAYRSLRRFTDGKKAAFFCKEKVLNLDFIRRFGYNAFEDGVLEMHAGHALVYRRALSDMKSVFGCMTGSGSVFVLYCPAGHASQLSERLSDALKAQIMVTFPLYRETGIC